MVDFQRYVGVDYSGALIEYFAPELSMPMRGVAQLEGWILGVL